MSSEVDSCEPPQTPSSLEFDASTPVPQKTALPQHTPTDSLVSISLSESDKKSEPENSDYNVEITPKDVVVEVLRRASAHASPIEFMLTEKILDSPGADVRLVNEVAFEKEHARSRSNSTVLTESTKRVRSDSAASDESIEVDWQTLEKTEQNQEEESDEQTTLLLARLEHENNAIATDPRSGLKTTSVTQSRPPSIYQLNRLVKEQGARSVRFSLLPAAASMTELDFWAALVRDYPQTAQRLPTITSNKIRSGVPAPLRGVVWVSMAGARERAIEENYDRLCGESSPYEKMIGKDIGRSFPQHEMFRDPAGDGQKMLGRVLKCYSLYDDKIGYCQGLGFLVGPLLMNMGEKEAFCVLVRLMEDYDLRACFLPDLSGLHLRIYQFNRLLRQHVPKVATHLENLGVEGEYLSQWFLSIFAVTCPLPLLFRIYDLVFAEGASETIMRVALSIMKINERKIVNYADFDDVMQLLLSRQLWDVYGLNPASADEFVMDFVSFTSLVTRESLDALEANFREAQGAAGGRSSFLPNVSSAASRFLGRLWSSPPKQQGLSPSHVHTNSTSRPTSTLLRTPSKQSLSTISSMEATSDFSTSTQSTAQTEVSTNSRENSINSEFVRSIKSTESVQPPFNRTHTQSTKEKELDGQIEDLLMMLSEMQKNQALLQAQLQKVQEDRAEDNVVIRAFIDQVKADISEHKEKKVTSHRRVASEVGNVLDMSASRPAMSPTTVRLLGSLDQRIRTRHIRSSSSLESKADLRASLASVKEQLYVETTRSQELSRQLDAKDQESASLRDELQKARSRIKDAHFDKQRLEKTVLELRAAQKQSALSRSNSKSSITDDDQGSPEKRESSESATKSGGLREFRLGRGSSGLSRNNTNAPTQIFSKRTSSLAHATSTTTTTLVSEPLAIPNALPIRHGATASVPNVPMSASAPPENDSLLLELVNAKTAEAVARQELDELKARFEAMRKMMTAVSVPVASSPSPPVQQSAFTPPALSTSSTASSMGESGTKQHQASASVSAVATSTATATVSSGFGFFGWGKR